MLKYPEELAYNLANRSLLKVQGMANYIFQTEEAKIEAANLLPEEELHYLSMIMNNYDQAMAQAEAEYDRAMNKIRSWKKIRRGA